MANIVCCFEASISLYPQDSDPARVCGGRLCPLVAASQSLQRHHGPRPRPQDIRVGCVTLDKSTNQQDLERTWI